MASPTTQHCTREHRFWNAPPDSQQGSVYDRQIAGCFVLHSLPDLEDARSLARLTVGVCKVHFLRNVLAQIPKGNAEMVLAAIRTIFDQPDATHVYEQFETIASMLGRQSPKVETMLRDARDDLLAFATFPAEHWKKIWSTNPLERLNREVKRRTDVVGVFPNPEALLRLAGSVLIEAHDEWAVSDRRYLSESSMAMLNAAPADRGGSHRAAASCIVLEELTCTVRNYTTTRDVTVEAHPRVDRFVPLAARATTLLRQPCSGRRPAPSGGVAVLGFRSIGWRLRLS